MIRLLQFWQKRITIALVIGITPFTMANATEDDIGIWTVFTSTDTFSSDDGDSPWSYWVDAQARYFDVGSGINQYLIRPAIGYQVRPNLQAWAGYARFQSRNRAGFSSHENRFWQQLNWTAGNFDGGVITMRARLLERSMSTGDDVGLVLRFMTKFAKPIGTDGTKTLLLSLEPFIDLNDTDWGGDSGIGQNRTYIGVGWRHSDELTIETGYMNQFVWRDGGENVSNHLAVLNFKVKF